MQHKSLSLAVNRCANPGVGLQLDFAHYGSLDPRITFARASTATYFDSTGTLQTASNGVPRANQNQDHNPSTLAPLGFLVEESRTNLLLRSAEFDNVSWTKGGTTVTANAATSPDGTANADKLLETATTAVHRVYQGISSGSDQVYTFSVFVKAAERTWCIVTIQNTVGGGYGSYVNLSTGAFGSNTSAPASRSIQNCGNGWYRVTITQTSAGAGTYYGMVWASTGDGVSSYAGNASSGIYVFGAQIEQGSFPTSYIATTTASATRAADTASMTSGNFTSWYNQSAGTFFQQYSVPFSATSANNLVASDGTANEQVILSSSSSRAGGSLRVVDGGSDQCNIAISSAYTAGQTIKQVGAYAANNFATSFNASAVSTDTSGTLPTVNALYIGYNPASGAVGNCHIQRTTYYPVRLPNGTLQGLTS